MRNTNNIIMLATGKKLPSERWYLRVLRDAEGNPTDETVRLDLSRPRVRVTYSGGSGEAA